MPERYYLDTSIWMDLYEDRIGFNNEPLGDFAWKLFALIKVKGHKIMISDLLLAELKVNYSDEQIKGMMKPFEDMIEKVIAKRAQRDEAENISDLKNIPKGDILHAIIARDNNLILITRDNHFKGLADISLFYRPEDLI